MSTNFPNSLDAFVAKIDNFDDVMAADVNNLQDAVAAIQALLGGPPLGWYKLSKTLIYASATTFTIAGDVTAMFPVGAKLKLTQTTVKYFYVISATYGAPNTTVTITGGSDYSLANAAITNPFLSYHATPGGFPVWFNFTPVWTATGTNPVLGDGTIVSKFKIDGGLLTWTGVLTMGSTTTFGAGNYYFTRPVPVAAPTRYYGFGYVRKAGVANYSFMIQTSSAETELRYFIDITPGTNNSFLTPTYPVTFAANDTVAWQIQYGI